jgi:two-component system, cell cycle response regulator CtrA
MAALFSTDADDPSEEKILDVWICKMRKKLKLYGIEIKTQGGECWEMPEAGREIARGLIAAER